MNLRQIKFAVAVADTGSFTKAADACNVVQSALSHQIAKLEQELGARLFERTSRAVKLTLVGNAFLPQARQMLAASERIREEVAAARGTVCGSLTVGTISTLRVLDLVDILAQFHQRFPHVDVRFYQGMSENLVADVREQRADAGFIGLWPGEPVEGVSKLTLADEELVALIPAGHALAQEQRISLLQLAGLPLVDFYANSGARRQTELAFAAAGVTPRVNFEVSHIDLLESIVRRGLAIGLVPRSAVPRGEQLAVVSVEGAPVRRVYAVWAQDPTPAASAFMDMVFAAHKAANTAGL